MNTYNIGEIEYNLPQGVINWYHFKEHSKFLYIYQKNSGLLDFFTKKEYEITCISLEEMQRNGEIEYFAGKFDYVIAIGVLEKCKEPEVLLSKCRVYLKGDGRLLLGADNRLGLKYFCGEKDPYSSRVFDGVEDYINCEFTGSSFMKGRNYSKRELLSYLHEAGWRKVRCYSVMPDLSCPQFVIADDFAPTEKLSNRYFPYYENPDTVFLKEEYLCDELIKNGIFHPMANAFLFECSLGADLSEINQVTISMDRGRENAMATIVKKDKVEKKALYSEGTAKLETLQNNLYDLKRAGVAVVEGKLQDGVFNMPFIEAELANTYLQRICFCDKEMFIKEMDRFRDAILNSSAHVDVDENKGVILQKGYLDMVPLNCFVINGEYTFFDQEFAIENYPANAIIYRFITIVYELDKKMEAILPQNFFWRRYGLEKNIDEWFQKSICFTGELRHGKELSIYHERHSRNEKTVEKNRFRMNYAEEVYEKLYYNPIAGLKGKKLIVFGAGRFAHKFLEMYRRDYDIFAVIDNDPQKWGNDLLGCSITSPDILKKMHPDEYKVVICLKEYEDALKQVKELGAADIAIYDKNKIYPGRQAAAIHVTDVCEKEPKKYHIGYVAGVFDLYHLGHLNMFRNAKKECDYLIVGVVTDEGVRNFKGTEPFVPFEERVEMIRSCRYVDEVVEIPYLNRGTVEAFEKYHFDVQFSGSDYAEEPLWLDMKKYLEENGAALVFFPYTQQTSSTKLKALIEKGLV